MVEPDYRTQRSPSPEGSGRARSAWKTFHFETALDLTEQAGATTTSDDLPGDIVDDVRAAVIEESELLGFWIAWQRAGGFAGLERAGWNRATIFRKVRRFRTAFSAHPDDYQPDWITLDLPKVWAQSLRRRLEPQPEP
ncbi:MAG TPA: hypothetical protein VFP61_00480 [Acidimicrobiales bacterium]|nr:hypothetical protein [Acidimicrobiales bacterium]